MDFREITIDALVRIIANKLQCFTCHITSFVKDFLEFIHKIHKLNLDEHDIMITYDGVSRFTKIH